MRTAHTTFHVAPGATAAFAQVFRTSHFGEDFALCVGAHAHAAPWFCMGGQPLSKFFWRFGGRAVTPEEAESLQLLEPAHMGVCKP
jgi:hypothetical protein